MKQLRDHHRFISKSCFLACLFGIVFFSSIAGADAGFSAAGRSSPVGGGGESLQTPKVCANHDCYYALAVDSSQPIAPVLRLALLKEETAIIGTWFATRAAAFDGMGNLNEGYFIPSQGDEDRYWQSIYMLAQAGTGPALAVPQVIRAPSRVVQPQNHDGGAGHILATLQVRNIQVRAKWDVKNEGNNFTVSALAGDSRQGVLRVGDNITLDSGDYVVTVMAIDEFDYLNKSYENLTAMAELTIVAEAGGLSFTEDSPFVNVTVGIPREGGLYTVRVSVGEDADYEQIGAHSSFTIDVLDGAGGAVVSMISPLLEAMTATLTIKASRDGARATLTLEVRAYDELSASLAAGFVGQTYTGETGVLGTVEVSGGSGGYVYSRTPVAGFSGVGSVLSANGQATVGVYTVTVVVSDNELDGWIAATAEATVSVGAALSLLGIDDRRALVQGEEGEELLTVQVSGGKQPYSISGQDLSSGLTISVLADSSQWVVKRAGNLSVGANVGTVIIDDSYSVPTPGTPALTAVLTIEGVDDLVIASPQTLTATMGVSGVLAELSAEGGTDAKVYKLSPELSGFSLSPAGVLSVSMDVDAGSHTLTVVVSDETARVEQAAMATLLVEVLERLQLLSVPSLTVTTSETQDVVYSFAVDGGVGEKIYSLENTVTGFGFEIDSGNLRWLGDAEAGLYTLSVLAKDGSPQPQESRGLVTVLVIEDVVLDVVVLSPVWSSFEGAVSTLSASGGNGGELVFGLVGDSQVFTLAAGSSTLSLNAGLRGHQGAATLSATVLVSDGNDSAAEVIEVLVSGALQVVLGDGLVAPVHAQYEGLVGSVLVLGGYAGDVSLTLSGSDKDKFELSGGSLSVRVDVSEEQMLTVTVEVSRGDETAAQEVVVSVYAPLGLSVLSVVTVATHKGDVLTIIEGSGGDASSYSYTLTSPPLVGVSINADNGELLLSLTVAASHTLTVELSDGVGSSPVSQKFSVVVVIEPLRDVGEVVLAVTLIEDVGDAAVHTFAVAGGIAPYSYTFIESQGLSVNAASGVLSYLADGAAPGVYVVAVSVDDTAAAIAPITLLLTVEVSAVLSAALSDGAKDGVDSFVKWTGVLSTVELSGAGGIPPYTFTLLANDNFGIDEDGKNFRITAEFASEAVVSVVWVLNDSDTERTPAVSGMVQVEIRDIVRPPAMVSDIVGEIVINGGGVDATYITGETPTFDPNIGGVTVDVGVHTESNSAKVELENGQIVVNAQYVPVGHLNPNTGEWIFFSAREIAELISLNVKPQFKGEGISFLDPTGVELAEAYNTPGMVAIIIGGAAEYEHIIYSVKYVGCHLVKWDEYPGGYSCSIRQPILDLSAALSDGARDGVDSFVNLTGVLSAVELSGVGGIPPYTFTLLDNDNFGIDEDGGNFRITAAFASATVVSVVWVLEDSDPGTPAVSGTVEVEVSVPPAALSVALSDGARDGAYSFVNLTGILSAVELSGVGGIPPYTFALLANDNFGIDEDGKNFRITAAFASETVATVVWVLEDSEPGTPAVSGTVRVEIRDIVRPPAMVRDIVGEILISGGGADGTYSAGQTPTFDPDIGGVTVDVQAEGNSAVVWLENAQIRVSAKYIPDSNFNPASGEWIFFSAREIAELVSLNANPEFKGAYISFNDANELNEAFSTPGMVAIIIGSGDNYGDITSQVRYVGCYLIEIFSRFYYNCSIRQPTSGFSATLSAALSDGTGDGVHSFVNLTGILSAVELSGAGGIPPYTFTLLANDNFGIDEDGRNFRITAAFASETVATVVWVLEDSNPGTPAVSGTVQVKISVPPVLSAVLSDGAGYGVHSFVNLTGVLPEVELSGAGGTPPYTFTLLDNDNFGIDEDGKNFRITAAFTSATVVSVVWVLEDSNPGTPAVSGTVQVETYVARPPAMVRDIVGEILISGGGADGTYSTGQTLTFDPNIGGVTVDAQADGNSAVVWLENAQIRVNAKYIPEGFLNLASGEWIFWSAREIAELVSLNADPEFKGERIRFTDAAELKEAFSTPGMVAIINPSVNDGYIVSQVRYVVCNFITVLDLYDCRIEQPKIEHKSPSAKNELRYVVVNDPYSETINIPVVGGVPDSTTGYTFALSPASGYGLTSTTDFIIVLEAANATYTDAGVNYVTVSIHDSQTPPQSGTFVLEVRVVPALAFADLVLTITQTFSESVAEHVTGGNTAYAEDNQRTFILGDAPNGLTIDDDGVLKVGGNVPYGGYAITINVTDSQPSQTATSNVSLSVVFLPQPVQVDTSGFPASLDPNAQLPYSVTLVGSGGSLNPTFTFSLEGAPSYVSIVGGYVVITTGPSAGDTVSFKIIVDDTAVSYDGDPMTVEINISFETAKAQYTVPSGVQVEVSEGTVTPVSGEANTFQFDPKTNDGVVLKVTGGDLTVTFIDWNLVIGDGNVMQFINAYAIRPSNLPEFTAGFDDLAYLFSQTQSWPINSGAEVLKWGGSGLPLIGATTGSEDGLKGKQAFIGQILSSFSPTETGLIVIMCYYADLPTGEQYKCSAHQDGIASTPSFPGFAKATRSTQSVKPLAVRIPSGARPNNPLFEANGTTFASGFFEGGFGVFTATGEENVSVTASPYLAN